ncbi:MAG: AAA family ATPase [Rubrivivax sp.]|nr:AAA family ATPase [Rubrivivax sp.]
MTRRGAEPPLHLQLSRAPQALHGASGGGGGTRGASTAALAPRDAALLAWLALEGATPRQRLAQLLWPESEPALARNTLRQRLFQLKRQLGAAAVEGTTLLALAAHVRHDLETSEEVLEGVQPLPGGEYDAWLARRRGERRRQQQAALAARIDAAERARDWHAALSLAQEMLARSPHSEAAHRRVMQLHYLAGDRSAALHAWERCRRMLADELAAAPSPETQALVAMMHGPAAEPARRPELAPRAAASAPMALVATAPALVATAPAAAAVPVALLRPPRMIGRDAALAALRAQWAAGQRVLVVGEPGIGKSRLLEALAQSPSRSQSQSQSHAWTAALTVRSRPGDEAVPLAGLVRVAEALARAPAGALAPAAAAALKEALAAPGGATATAAATPAAAATPHDSAAQARPRAQSLAPALLQALTAVAACGVALVLDDWQFADAASVDLWHEALDAPALAGLRVAIGSRIAAGAVADARIARLRARSDVRTLALGPLDEAAATALVESLLGTPGDAPHDVAAGAPPDRGDSGPAAGAPLAVAVHRRVGGNPLFMLEALRQWWAAPRQASVPPPAPAVPGHVRTLVAERIAQLPEEARQLLRVAALAGSDFSVALAEAVSGCHALALAEPWRLLEEQGLLGAAGVAHDVHAEVVLEQLPRPIAQALHARLAAFLESDWNAAARQPARLAAHWRAAGEDARAAPHLEAAARQAWRAARPAELLALYAQAAQIEAAAGREARAFELWFDAADAASECGSVEQAQQCLAALGTLARSNAEQMRVRFVEAVVQAMAGRPEEGLSRVSSLLGDAIAVGDLRVESECRFALANRAAADAQFDEAVQHLAAAERLLRDASDPRRAEALAATRALVLGLRGRPALALPEHERMLPLLKAHGDHATWVVVSASKSVQHLRRGEFEPALAEAARARQGQGPGAGGASIAPPDLLVVLRNLIETYAGCAQYAQALEVAEEFTARLARQGAATRAIDPIAALYLQLGRADLAQPWLDAVRASAPVRRRERSRLALLELKRALLLGRPAGQAGAGTPVAAGADAGAADPGGDLPLAVEWALWRQLGAQAPASGDGERAALETLVRRCEEGGMSLVLPVLRMLLAGAPGGHEPARLADAAGAVSLSAPAGNAAADLGALTPWQAWAAARALHAAGAREEARACARRGLQWVRDTAQQRVPQAFRASFAERHPLHRELARLATRG